MERIGAAHRQSAGAADERVAGGSSGELEPIGERGCGWIEFASNSDLRDPRPAVGHRLLGGGDGQAIEP